MRKFVLVAAVAVWAAAGGQGRAGQFSVPMSVTEPAGLARRAEPVSGGMPLPRGRFKKDQPFAVFAADGREIPSQVLPMVVDPDGTVRWVLVDFADDIAAGARKRYTLRAVRPGVRPRSPVKVTRTAGGVTVDTGKLRFSISSRKPFSLFSTVEVAGRRVVDGGRVLYTDGFPVWNHLKTPPKGLLEAVRPGVDLREVAAEPEPTKAAESKTYLAGPPERIDIEWAGPMRVTLAVRGHFVGDEFNRFQYIARITAWAGSSAVHVKYSLCNSNPEHYCYRPVRRSAIELKLTRRPGGTILGAGKPLRTGPEAWLVQTLLKRAARSARAGTGRRQLWASAGWGDEAEGWVAARLPGPGSGGGTLTVLACDLYFADDPARKLETRGETLALNGIIERPASEARSRFRPYRDRRRCLTDCSHLSSQYLIDFDAPAEPAALTAEARRGQHRLHLLATPKWYLQDTEAMPYGKFGTQADEMTCYQTWGWKYDPADAPRRPPRHRTYGRFFRGIDNHYEPEEDALDQMLIMYLRTGARPYFDNAHAWANYAMDLYAWRTDGWRFKDGGVWWYGGPKGHRPQRLADPVTGYRNSIPTGWGGKVRRPWTLELVRDNYFLSNSKSCYCHNWAQGLLAWYCLTGERDALAAAIDRVEQDYDTHRRARGQRPGGTDRFSRDFTRASYNAHAARLVVPQDKFVRRASEYFAAVYLRRPTREPRGLVNAAKPWRRRGLRGGLAAYVGQAGLAELKRLGYRFDESTGRMTDPRTGRSWYVLLNPHTWMFPPLSRAMELYYRLTGNEDAMDWVIAYGQAAARVLFQRHCLLTYGRMLVDFPRRGVARDYAAWVTGPENKYAEGIVLSGYLARFHPDVCARAYSLCGEPILKERAYKYWFGGSHRGYHTTRMKPLDRVGMWLDYQSTHDGQTDFVGRTIYIWSHPRRDDRPPAAIGDLKVQLQGSTARVSFTAPADHGGGRVARYQLKCAARPIVEYETFLKAYNEFREEEVCNWWMAANLKGEPAPGPPGRRESFVVTGVPEGARYFAVRSFDDSNNRSRLSNVAAAGR